MTVRESPALQALTPAQRARTVVASSGVVRQPGEEQVGLPFVEQAGSLLLVVTEEQRHDLVEQATGEMWFDGTPAIGRVRLSGMFWPVAPPAAAEILDDLRAGHAECLDCPGRRLTQLVGLQIETVELQGSAGNYEPVDLGAYVAAEPDWVLAHGVSVLAHVNAAHPDEVLQAAAALTGQPTGQVLTAQVDWLDGHGFDLSLIDGSGGHSVRCVFDLPVVDPDRLSNALHNALEFAIHLEP